MANLPTTTQLRGLALPALKGAGGYFETKTALDVAWGDLMNAILTPRGSRFMRRSFGSALHEQLFEPNTDDQQEIVDYVIREAAQEHCPHLQIRSVSVYKSEVESNRVLVRVTFALLTDTSQIQDREVLVPKVYISASLV